MNEQETITNTEQAPKPKWTRQSDAERFAHRYRGWKVTKFRGRKAKAKTAQLKAARKSEVRQMKRELGGRLNAEEMVAAAVRAQPELAAI